MGFTKERRTGRYGADPELAMSAGMFGIIKPYSEITDSGLASLKAFAQSYDDSIVMVTLMHVRSYGAYKAPLADKCTGYEAAAL